MAVCVTESQIDGEGEKPGPALLLSSHEHLTLHRRARVHGGRRVPEDPSIFSILPAAVL